MAKLTPEVDHEVVSVEEDITPVLEFIRKNLNSLEDADDRKGMADNLAHLEAAAEMVGDNNLYATSLYDAATKHANQLAFRLYVEQNLSDSMAEEFRSLRTVKEVSAMAASYVAQMREEADAITKLQQDYMAERKPFEIFQAVIAGMSKEEAEAKQAEYDQRRAQAIQNAAQQGA